MQLTNKILNRLVEPFIVSQIEQPDCTFLRVNAVKLLTWNRLDLAFKLAFLDLKDKNSSFSEEIYWHDIKSQTLGSFEEFGAEEKNNFSKYKASFLSTYNNIKENGFDEGKSLIPLSESGSVINGAHRLASAIHTNQEVGCVKTNLPVMRCDYQYFLDRAVPQYILDYVVTKYIEYADDVFLGFLWPSGKSNIHESLNEFGNIVYMKKIKLSATGAFNLLFELYKHMDWLGNRANGFQGVKKKLLECFPTFDDVYVIAFQEGNFDDVLKIKRRVRDINEIGYSSIHITDTKDEAERISKLVFNDNGLHFLNFSNPHKFLYSEELTELTDFLSKNEIKAQNFLVDGSFVATLYGLRKSMDIDYLSDEKIRHQSDSYDAHDSELQFHGIAKEQLIYNPSFYFEYLGIKFISFSQLFDMKQVRGEEKDLNDCRLMQSYISNDKVAVLLFSFKQKLFYSKLKTHKFMLKYSLATLNKIGLYRAVRFIYRYIKGV